MKEKNEILNNLPQFYGSEQFYKLSPFSQIVATDGVKYVADSCDSYWLVTDILAFQLEPKVKKEGFQVWKLSVKDNSGTLTCEDGNGNVVYKNEGINTDFPLDEITLWVTDGVILLPSEY